MNTLRILVADDHEVARKGIRALLETHEGWEVCAEARDGREAVQMATGLKPDILLLDIGMPNLNGLDAARQIRALAPDARILFLTMHDSEQMAREVLCIGGTCSLLLKSDAGRVLVAAIEALQNRETFVTSKLLLATKPERPFPSEDKDRCARSCLLTFREREVLQLVAEGKTTKEVATALNLSIKTAETHRANLMRKLGLHSVADVTVYAVKNGIVQIY